MFPRPLSAEFVVSVKTEGRTLFPPQNGQQRREGGPRGQCTPMEAIMATSDVRLPAQGRVNNRLVLNGSAEKPCTL